MNNINNSLNIFTDHKHLNHMNYYKKYAFSYLFIHLHYYEYHILANIYINTWKYAQNKLHRNKLIKNPLFVEYRDT